MGFSRPEYWSGVPLIVKVSKIAIFMVKNPPANPRNAGLIPESGRSPEGGNGNPLQCSCLENPRDRGAWWAAVYGVTQADMTEAT